MPVKKLIPQYSEIIDDGRWHSISLGVWEDETDAMIQYEPDFFVWVLTNPRIIRPFPIIGQQGLFYSYLPDEYIYEL